MKRFEFKIAGTLYKTMVPENWDEVTHDQFVTYAGAVVDKTTMDFDTIRRILNLDDVVTYSLTPSDWYFLKLALSFMENIEGYRVGLMDDVTLPDGTKCYGFSDDFSDVTWQEWMIADAQAGANRWDIFAAVMYRPRKENWDHKSEPRVEFSRWDCDQRLPLFQKLPSEQLAAIALNYKCMRRLLTRRYRRLFSGVPTDEMNKGHQNVGTDLHTLINNVMGDNFYEEEKYLHLAVPSVLFQLDRMVREEKERKRHARANRTN